MSDYTRYPLAWPVSWKRTPWSERQRADFKKTRHDTVRGVSGALELRKRTDRINAADAAARLDQQLMFLGATGCVLSTNIQLRLDGLPRASQAEPSDPGAAVYFQFKGKPTVLACDRWNRVADNIAALANHIDATRRIDRYGVGSLEQAFAGYAAIPQKTGGEDWRAEMGFKADERVSVAELEARYRALAVQRHPDSTTGHHEAMARLNVARAAARAEL